MRTRPASPTGPWALRCLFTITTVIGLCSCSSGGGHDTSSAGPPSPCADVPFTSVPSSQLAFHVVAQGVDCATARSVATGAAHDSAGEPFVAHGFDCTKTGSSPPSGISFIHFTCGKGQATVSFDAQPVS